MPVTLLECGVCGKPARDRCEHLANVLCPPAVTHWDSPEGQTQSCANCDVLAAENAKLRELLGRVAAGSWIPSDNWEADAFDFDDNEDRDSAIELGRQIAGVAAEAKP